jgi:hypothetical protein
VKEVFKGELPEIPTPSSLEFPVTGQYGFRKTGALSTEHVGPNQDSGFKG